MPKKLKYGNIELLISVNTRIFSRGRGRGATKAKWHHHEIILRAAMKHTVWVTSGSFLAGGLGALTGKRERVKREGHFGKLIV